MTTAFDFTFKGLAGGEPVDMAAFRGRAVLLVNVASACGYTPQYRDLEALFKAKEKAGLVVIGVPCNEFGGQEKGEEADIRAFCAESYHVTFPMTGKVDIVGPNRHPFFAWVAEQAGNDALPRWNFHKYLIGRDGGLVDSFPSGVTPLSPEMLGAVGKALAA
jgi:glutathione peroxidase